LFEQDVAHDALVLSVEIGVHEADRDRSDAPALQDACDVARCRHVERLDHFAGGVNAFGYGQSVPPRYIRFDDILVGVPEVFLVGASDFDDVAKTLGRHYGGAGQAARDQGVGCDRGPVREQRDLGKVNPGLGNAAHDAIDGITGRRRLLDADEAGCLVHDADVGEGAADIDSHAKILRHWASFRTRTRHGEVEACARAHPDLGSGCREQLVQPANFRDNAKIIRRSPAGRLTLSAGRFAPESTSGPIFGPGSCSSTEFARAKPRVHRSVCSRTGCGSSG
jgi:hypothetical protein